MGTISVKNHCNGGITVSVNQWDATGSVDYYQIDSQQTGTWDREDPYGRGFIMRVRTFGSPSWDLPYYVYQDSNIDVFEMKDWSDGQNVTDGGRRLNPAGQGGNT